MDVEKLKKVSADYFSARVAFFEAVKNDNLLHGNDNIVGRIGEFIAVAFLQEKFGRRIEKNLNKTTKGFDLIEVDEPETKISVKMITAENGKGTSTQVKNPWTEFILITLNGNYKVDRIGHITKAEIRRAVTAGFIGKEEPVASRRMNDDRGLFETFGRLYKGADVSTLL